ncbi:HAD family hydrolase [Gammaproteobacteria bacterium]|nr:HAD family hydrolase [Gammaproteobacteria bacterium]
MAERSLPYDMIILDWDDTLIDSSVLVVQTFITTLEQLLPGTVVDPQFIRQKITGHHWDTFLQELGGSTFSVAEFNAAFEQNYFKQVSTQCPVLFDGVKSTLKQLLGQDFRLAIATGKARNSLNYELKQFALSDYFVATICADETRNKPDPMMLHKLFDMTGCQAQQCLMVGDSTLDVTMAHSVHMDAVGLLTGQVDQATFETLKPKAILDHVNDLPAWLSSCQQ